MDIELTERAFLADLLAHAGHAFALATRYRLRASNFSRQEYAAAWEAMCALESPDQLKLLQTVRQALKIETVEEEVRFLDLQSPTMSGVDSRLREIIMASYRRDIDAAYARAAAVAQKRTGDPRAYLQWIQEAVSSIPEPIFPGSDDEAVHADATAASLTDELPDELLHVPGFIDELTAYTLRTAIRPNRTLAFAGALALLAHLMGRKYTDRRGTRSNLYLLALGPTGCGKDYPRRVNRLVLKGARLSQTVFDQIGSGEAIEEALWHHPAILLQMDEVQTTFQSLKQAANSNAQGIYRYLLTFYSTSGSDHTMRLKVGLAGRNSGEEIGRVIHDPSLTLFGTGIPDSFYRSLTQEALENGLAGRCLAFATNVKAEPNDFEGERPPVPSLVQACAAALSRRADDMRNDPGFEPEEVPYAEGVNKRLLAIGREADQLGLKCDAGSNAAGSALWARAAEKVGKLALVYAVSENQPSPVITLGGVEWAWQLVKTLTFQMIDRANRFITSGPVDEDCRRVLSYLTRLKQSREKDQRKYLRGTISSNLHIVADQLRKVEETLVDRNQIEVIELGRKSAAYRLVSRKRRN